MRHAHHPFIEPTHDVVETFDTMPGLSRAREFVRLPGKNNHGGGTIQILEGTEQLFAARILRRAEVGFAQHKQHWRMDVLDKRDRRPVAYSPAGSSKGGALNQFGWKSMKSAVYHHDAQLEMSRCDTAAAKRLVCVTVQSVSTPPPLPPVTPSFFRVDIAALENFIDADHQVAIVVARIVILNDIAEFLTIAGRAPRVEVEHHVAFGSHPLKFMIEDPAVSGMRAAVNVEDERVLLLRIEVGRFLDPTLNGLAIEAVVIDFLRRGQIQLRPEYLVKVGDTGLRSRRRQPRRDRQSSRARR